MYHFAARSDHQPLVGDVFGLPRSNRCVVMHLSVLSSNIPRTHPIMHDRGHHFFCPWYKQTHCSQTQDTALHCQFCAPQTSVAEVSLRKSNSISPRNRPHTWSSRQSTSKVRCAMLHECAVRTVNSFLANIIAVPWRSHSARSVTEQFFNVPLRAPPSPCKCLPTSFHLDFRNERSSLQHDLLSHSLSVPVQHLVSVVCVSDARPS